MYRNNIVCLAIFAFLTISVSSRAADIEKDLFLYLPMDEGAGNSVKDYGPNNFKTEMSDKKPKWVGGKKATFDKSLQFDGKSTFVKIDAAGQGKDFDAHTDKGKGMTICAWVKVGKTGTDGHGQNRQPIVMKGAGGAWEFALLVYDGLEPGMSVWDCPGNGVSEPSGGSLGNEWRYQCGTYSTKEGVKVYLDGKKNVVTQGANAGDPCGNGKRPIFIAHREDGQWLNADIAQVRMWERIITVEEMAMAMNTNTLAVRRFNKLPIAWGEVKSRL